MNIVITSPSESITKTIDKAADLVRRAYAMNSADGLAEETFLSIIALNALGKEHEAIQFQLQDRLQQATPQSPFSFTQIRAFLEDKQHLIDANKHQNNPASTPSSIALSAQNTQANNLVLCSNCGKCGHQDKYCISQGGGMAGKTIEESKAQRRINKDTSKMKSRTLGTSSGSSQKVCIPYKDANGQALILKVDANVFQALPAPTSASFAGIASAPTPTESYSTETLEMEGWMASYDVRNLPNITLPSMPITTEDFVLSAYNQASMGYKLIDSIPFKFDSGASAPISLIRKDFINYRSVTPHDVRGLGGVVVQAVGIGNIVIHQTPDRTFILYNALHIPNAGVCLVSVSALWRYSGQKVCFDGPTCTVTLGTNVVATGTLNHKTGLYNLDIPHPTVSAYTITASPTIETWHHHLGHTNYQCIQNMARKGTVKGLPSSLSSLTPSKCISCVLGKQTKTSVPKKCEEGKRATRRLDIVL